MGLFRNHVVHVQAIQESPLGTQVGFKVATEVATNVSTSSDKPKELL